MVDLYAKIDSCDNELELEKIKAKILFEISFSLHQIARKKLTYK